MCTTLRRHVDNTRARSGRVAISAGRRRHLRKYRAASNEGRMAPNVWRLSRHVQASYSNDVWERD